MNPLERRSVVEIAGVYATSVVENAGVYAHTPYIIAENSDKQSPQTLPSTRPPPSSICLGKERDL